MSTALPKLYLARHGDTAGTDSHRHTGRTDLLKASRGSVVNVSSVGGSRVLPVRPASAQQPKPLSSRRTTWQTPRTLRATWRS
jgi:hypothetical protein